MTVVSIKQEAEAGGTGSGGLVRVELSDGSLFLFRVCYLSPLSGGRLGEPPGAEGCELEDSEEEALRFAAACLKAERKALRLIARAEQSLAGLERKLKRAGHEGACVRAALARLSGLDAVNDGRFAELWLLSRLDLRADSPRRLLSALRSRGIDRSDAEQALKKIVSGEAEFELLERYAEKHGFGDGSSTRADGANIASLLRYEGFSPASVRRFRENLP
jgi:regulatory protein